jgi:pre-mRNA-splicing factor ATP-dependent RNA helicase DHX15/PRP43
MSNKIGILDPTGKNLNPLTNTEYSEKYKKLGEIWSKFPAYEMAESIIDTISKNQVILVISGTGSGKTVLIPKYMLHVLNYDGRVVTTLPKQILAKSTAEFAAETLDVKIGEEVGYQYKGSPSSSKSNKTKLLYATDGTIVARLLNDPKLQDFDAVIIDEAHERKVQIDFLLLLLKKTLDLRPEFKLIIMSATVNSEIFGSYYNEYKYAEINIGGKTNYPIESIFTNKSLDYNETLEKGYDILKNILQTDDPTSDGSHDILFFITSKNEALDMCKKLNKFTKDEGNSCVVSCIDTVYCVEVFSGMDSYKENMAQDKVLYKKNNKYLRKVVFATNVAESSLTIDGIKYVIDTGYELKSYYDPDKRANVLNRGLITHAQAKQRMGRSGRTESGVCYHLYTKEDFEQNMERFPKPDIRVSDISGECLRLLSLDQIQTIELLLKTLTGMIEPPKENYIMDALMKLQQMDLISTEGITELGKLVSNVSNDPMIGKALIYSKVYNCSYEMAKIISLLDASHNTMSDIFTYNNVSSNIKNHYKDNMVLMNKKLKEIDEKFKKAQNKFKHKSGDHLSLLNVYEEFVKKCKQFNINIYNLDKIDKKNMMKLEDYCNDHFLKLKTLLKAVKYTNKIKHSLNNINITNITLDTQIINKPVADRLLYSLYAGFNTNEAHLESRDNKYKLSNNILTDIDKLSFLNLKKKKSKKIIYQEYFIMMNNHNLNMVSISI